MHESFDREDDVKVGTERSFGLVFAVVFTAVGLWPLIDGGGPRLWSLGVAAGFLLAALVAPRALRPLNLLWFKFGMLLHHVVTPLVMGLLFFATVTPIALLMRIFGKRPLDLAFEPDAKSYWIERDPPGPEPGSMKRQF